MHRRDNLGPFSQHQSFRVGLVPLDGRALRQRLELALLAYALPQQISGGRPELRGELLAVLGRILEATQRQILLLLVDLRCSKDLKGVAKLLVADACVVSNSKKKPYGTPRRAFDLHDLRRPDQIFFDLFQVDLTSKNLAVQVAEHVVELALLLIQFHALPARSIVFTGNGPNDLV